MMAMTFDAGGEPTPDFTGLYMARVDVGGLSPRLAYYLWHCAAYLADTWRLELDDHPGELVAQLPPIVGRLTDAAWLARFVGCFDALAERFAAGDVGYPGVATCTGEEMALHLVIDLAEAFVYDGVFDDDNAVRRLPNLRAHDDDFGRAREILFHDHDVLNLFDPALDGIEDSGALENIELRLVNLHPRQWFAPFAQPPSN